jgi:hypothetical protein
VFREGSLIHIKRGLLLFKSAQLLGLTVIVMAIVLLMGNGSKFLKNIWADEIIGTEGDDNFVGTINADNIKD